jgi:SAM-dependent methyltransferase
MLEALKLKIPLKDQEFDSIYPSKIKKLSERHFTPFNVAKVVSEWLNEYKESKNVLDLGCGVGKFCFIVGSLTQHQVYGVDYREEYIHLCERLNAKYGFKNVHFLNKNITEMDFRKYNVFYFFNSFLEQIDYTAKFDTLYERSSLIYGIYETFLRNELSKLPAGTLVITYYTHSDQIPKGYEVIKYAYDSKLLMWIKR